VESIRRALTLLPSLCRGVCPILLTFAFFCPQRGAAQTSNNLNAPVSPDKQFAILIGVSEYDDPRLLRLQGPSTDVQSLRVVLERELQFPEENIVSLTSKSATRNGILQALYSLASEAPPDGLVVVAFSGLAFEKRGRDYLLPFDGVASEFIDETGIPLDLISGTLDKSRFSRMVVFLDTTFQSVEGGYTSGLADKAVYSFAKSSGSRCSAVYLPSGVAYENPATHQGLFTQAVVEGLGGQAQNSDGQITASGLAKYLVVRMDQASQTLRGLSTKTFSQIFCPTDFVIGRGTRRPKNATGLTYYLKATIHPTVDVPVGIQQTFSVNDSREGPAQQIRSSTFCLDGDIVLRIGEYKILSRSSDSKPLGSAISGRCVTVDYQLGSGANDPFSARAWINFEFSVDGLKHVTKALDPYESPRVKIESSTALPTFQYPGEIPKDAKDVTWQYTVDVIRIAHDQLLGDVRISSATPNKDGVKSSISADGRLVVDPSDLIRKWSTDAN
jgi:hypothetical protein